MCIRDRLKPRQAVSGQAGGEHGHRHGKQHDNKAVFKIRPKGIFAPQPAEGLKGNLLRNPPGRLGDGLPVGLERRGHHPQPVSYTHLHANRI